MSNRTQQEGRTPYTEREFVFKPRWNVDLLERENAVWLRMLLWETRRFDPTFDPNSKRDAMDLVPGEEVSGSYIPHLEFDVMPVITAPYNGTVEWSLTGRVTNYKSTYAYSPVALTVSIDGAAPINGSVGLHPDGTFVFTPDDAMKTNVTGDIDVVGTVAANGKSSNTASTVIRMKLVPVDPEIVSGVAPTSIIIGSSAPEDQPTLTGTVTIPAPATLRILVAIITDAKGNQANVVVPVNPDGSYSYELPNDLFARGKNTLEIRAVSVLNGHTSSASVFGPIEIVGRKAAVPAVVTLTNKTVWEVAKDVVITGTVVLEDKDTTIASAVLQGLDADYDLTVVDGKFSFTYPGSKVPDPEALIISASVIARRDELNSTAGIATQNLTISELPAAPTITVSATPAEIESGNVRGSVDVTGTIDGAVGTTVKYVSVSVGTTVKNANVNGNTFKATLPNSAFAIGTNTVTATGTVVKDGLESLPGSGTTSVNMLDSNISLTVNAPTTVDKRTVVSFVVSGEIALRPNETVITVELKINNGSSVFAKVTGNKFTRSFESSEINVGANEIDVIATTSLRVLEKAVGVSGIVTPATPVITFAANPSYVYEGRSVDTVFTGTITADAPLVKTTIRVGNGPIENLAVAEDGSFSVPASIKNATLNAPLVATVTAVSEKDGLKSETATQNASVAVKKLTADSKLSLSVVPNEIHLDTPENSLATLVIEPVGDAQVTRVRMKAGITGFYELPVNGNTYTFDIDPLWLVEGDNQVVAEVTTFVDEAPRVLTTSTVVTVAGRIPNAVVTVSTNPQRVPEGVRAKIVVSGSFIAEAGVTITEATLTINGSPRPLTFVGNDYSVEVDEIFSSTIISVSVKSEFKGKPVPPALASTSVRIYEAPIAPAATIVSSISDATTSNGASFAVNGTLDLHGFPAVKSEFVLNGEVIGQVNPTPNWSFFVPFDKLKEGTNTLGYRVTCKDGVLESQPTFVTTTVMGIVRVAPTFDFTVTPASLPLNGDSAVVNGTVQLREEETVKSVEVTVSGRTVPGTINGANFAATIPGEYFYLGGNNVLVTVVSAIKAIENPAGTKTKVVTGIGAPDAPTVTATADKSEVVAGGAGDDVTVTVNFTTGDDIEFNDASLKVGQTTITAYTVVGPNTVTFNVANSLIVQGSNALTAKVTVKRFRLVSPEGTGAAYVRGMAEPAKPEVTILAEPNRVAIPRESETSRVTVKIKREAGATNKSVVFKVRGITKPMAFGPTDNELTAIVANADLIVGTNAIEVTVIAAKDGFESKPTKATSTITGVILATISSVTVSTSQDMIAINYPSQLGTSGTVVASPGATIKTVVVKVGSYTQFATINGMTFTANIPSDKFAAGANDVVFTTIVTASGYDSDPNVVTKQVEGLTELHAPTITLTVAESRPVDEAWSFTGKMTGPKGTLPSYVNITHGSTTRPVSVLRTDGTFTHNVAVGETTEPGPVTITATGAIDLDGLISAEGTASKQVEYVGNADPQKFLFVPNTATADFSLRVYDAETGSPVQRILANGTFSHMHTADGLKLMIKSVGTGHPLIYYRFKGNQYAEVATIPGADINAENTALSWGWGAFGAGGTRFLHCSVGNTSSSGRYAVRITLWDVQPNGMTKLGENVSSMVLNGANAHAFPVVVNGDGSRWLWPVGMTTSSAIGFNRLITFNGTTLTNGAAANSATYPGSNSNAQFQMLYPVNDNVFIPLTNNQRVDIYTGEGSASKIGGAQTVINTLTRQVPNTRNGGWLTVQNGVLWKYFRNDAGVTNANMTAPTGLGTVRQYLGTCPDPMNQHSIIVLISINPGDGSTEYRLGRIPVLANGTFGAGTIIGPVEALGAFNANYTNVTCSMG